MSFIDAAAIRHLRSHGLIILSPDDPTDAPSAAHHLGKLGYRVFPPLAAPEVGSLWKRTRGMEVVREVVAVAGGCVTYRVQGVEAARPPVTLKVWHDWRTQGRAKLVTV